MPPNVPKGSTLLGKDHVSHKNLEKENRRLKSGGLQGDMLVPNRLIRKALSSLFSWRSPPLGTNWVKAQKKSLNIILADDFFA